MNFYQELDALEESLEHMRWAMRYIFLSLAFDIASIIILFSQTRNWFVYWLLLTIGGWISLLMSRHYRKEADRSYPSEK